MSNSIDINLSNENNAMNSLQFYWKAFFSSGKVIEQFENGIEHRFQEVKDDFENLIKFSLVNKDYSKYFVVDLEYGFILHNNYNLNNINFEQLEQKNNIRLIHFRRHFVEIGTKDLKEKSHQIIYFLGLQWQDSEEKNHKIILQIDENGDFIING